MIVKQQLHVFSAQGSVQQKLLKTVLFLVVSPRSKEFESGDWILFRILAGFPTVQVVDVAKNGCCVFLAFSVVSKLVRVHHAKVIVRSKFI